MTYRDKTEADQARIAALEQLLAEKEAALVLAKSTSASAEKFGDMRRQQRRTRVGLSLVALAIFAMLVALLLGSSMGFSARAERMLLLVTPPCVAVFAVGILWLLSGIVFTVPVGQVVAMTTSGGLRVFQSGHVGLRFPWMSARFLSIQPRTVQLTKVLALGEQHVCVRLNLVISPENTTHGVARYLERWGSKNADELMIAFVHQKAEVLLQDLAAFSKPEDWTQSRDELQDKFESLFKEPAEHAAIVLEDCTLFVAASAGP